MSYYSQSLVCPNRITVSDFSRTVFRGRIGRLIAFLTGRSEQLLNMETITQGRNVRSCHYSGMHAVKIANIKGSESCVQDFDREFHPLRSHCCERWLSIARAWKDGITLPPIELIKVEDVYVVRDGHHRISVARYMGSDFIDARVTEWVLEG